MEIKKHGNTYELARCKVCNCEFSYTRNDIKIEWKKHNEYVECPECGKIIQTYSNNIKF
ncbi:MAG: hypothetical protein HFJ34_08860 [Clostridia bacterium]|nr:hypothetical protein [Clostridia bacterium]